MASLLLFVFLWSLAGSFGVFVGLQLAFTLGGLCGFRILVSKPKVDFHWHKKEDQNGN